MRLEVETRRNQECQQYQILRYDSLLILSLDYQQSLQDYKMDSLILRQKKGVQLIPEFHGLRARLAILKITSPVVGQAAMNINARVPNPFSVVADYLQPYSSTR